MEKHSVIYNNEPIEFTLIRKSVKNINLRVKADLSVVVSAGKNVPLDFIIGFVTKKAQWIRKSLDKYSSIKTEIGNPKEFISGEEFALFGKKFKLKIVESKDEHVKLHDNFLEIYIIDREDLRRKKSLIENFYREQLISYIDISVEKILEVIQRVEKPTVIIKKMKTRWGYCKVYKNTIVLNSALVYVPKHCIDYVVLHELLHFSIPNHSKTFYNKFANYMLDWKECKKLLNEINIRQI